jgi:hypothetical protein
VRAKDGAVTLSSVNAIKIQEGYFEGNGGGITLRSRDHIIQLADLLMVAGSTGQGIDIEAALGITVSGRADLTTGAGPLRMISHRSFIILDGVYSIYTGSGEQEYRANAGVVLRSGSILSSNTGGISIRSGDVVSVWSTSSVASVEGDIHVVGIALLLRNDALIHSGRGAIRIDSQVCELSDDARLGRGSFSHGPIDIRCYKLVGVSTGPQGHIHGSSVTLDIRTDGFYEQTIGAFLHACPIRAESGDLVIRSEGPVDSEGALEARGNIRLESEQSIELVGASLRTHDRTEGTSGSILVRSWGGEGAHVWLTDSSLATGDAPVASGDIDVLIGELESVIEEPGASWILPKRVVLKLNERDPTRSKVVVSGFCDLGLGAADLTAAATLEVGGLDIDVPGMVAKGKKFSHKDGSPKVTFKASKSGSSLAKFKMTVTADLTGLVDPESELTMRFAGAGVDGTGTVRLTKGKYALGKVRGALVEPGLYLAKAKAAVKGAGKDKLALTLGLTTDGTTPAAASDLSIGFGDHVAVTIPAAEFTRNGDRYEFRGDADGITKVVIDYARETITVKGKGMDLGTVPEGPVEVDVSVGLGAESRAVRVRMVRSGSALRY